MADDLFTWTDTSGRRGTVFAHPARISVKGASASPYPIRSVDLPTGEDAAALASAFLAAAGDTGHVVMDQATIDAGLREWREWGARSMRERAAEATIQRIADQIVQEEKRVQSALAAGEQTLTLPHLNGRLVGLQRARAIATALPLLPDGGGEPKKSGRVEWLEIDGKQVHESPQELASEIDRPRKDNEGAFDRGHMEGFADGLRMGEARADEVAHSGCSKDASETPSEQPAAVHVATPEGITPCGEGHHDVTVTALIAEATCVECLRTLAQAPQDDITEAGAHRTRTWTTESADTWPATPADLPHIKRQMDEWTREVAAITDLQHNPLADRVAQLERDMGRMEREAPLVGARLDALEIAARENDQSGGAEHAEVAGGSAPEPCPVRAWNAACLIEMVCHHDQGHTGPHYNPASGGWEWTDGGTVTQLDGRDPSKESLLARAFGWVEEAKRDAPPTS